MIVHHEQVTGARHEVVALAEPGKRPVEEVPTKVELPTTSGANREMEQDV